MNSKLMKKDPCILALGTLGLMARGTRRMGRRTGQPGSWQLRSRPWRPRYQQSQMFSEQINARQDRQMERIQAGSVKAICAAPNSAS